MCLFCLYVSTSQKRMYFLGSADNHVHLLVHVCGNSISGSDVAMNVHGIPSIATKKHVLR